MTMRGPKFKTRFALLSVAAVLCLPSPVLASGIDKKVSDVCRTNKSAAFRAKYCSAAKDYKKAYTASLASSAIWGGVTTVCGLACGKAGPGGMTCKISSMAGTAGEGVLTKKFTDALKGEAMQYGKEVLTKDGKSEATTAATDTTAVSEGKVNGDACMVAGTSALKGYEKLSNSKQSEKSIGQLREQTKGMNSATNGSAVFTAAGPKGPNSADDGVTAEAMTGGDTCGDNALKTAKGAIRCATSADPTLPGFVQTEEFLKDIQKATGKTADEFFASYESPGQALMEAPGMASLSGEQKSGVAESLSMMDRYSELKVAGKVGGTATVASAEKYTKSGGAAKASDAEDGFDVNGVIANMLGQMGEEGEKPAEDGVNTLALGVNRMPAEKIISPEDRTISIFSRVEWRYRAVTNRDHLGVEK